MRVPWTIEDPVFTSSLQLIPTSGMSQERKSAIVSSASSAISKSHTSQNSCQYHSSSVTGDNECTFNAAGQRERLDTTRPKVRDARTPYSPSALTVSWTGRHLLPR